MTKLNSIIYKKLCAQAEEAKENGMVKLASSVMDAIGDNTATDTTYSYAQLKDDAHKNFWKVALDVMRYYDIDAANIQSLDKAIDAFASELIKELEHDLGTESIIVGPNEPKVFGEK